MRNFVPLLALAVILLCGSTAFAHPQAELHTHAGGFDAGLFHPLFGLDHLLAMLTVGILAAQAGGRATWVVPAAFLGCMIVGGFAGISGSALWGPELGIAASVILLGAAVAAGKNLPLGLLLGACGIFGFFHGHAHGSEMPSIAEPMPYATGFVLATSALHIAGIGIGKLMRHTPAHQRLLRFSGVLIAAAGVSFLF